MDGKIRDKISSGTQEKLDELSRLEAFDVIVTAEIASRKLVKEDVLQCSRCIYHEVSKHAHGNDGTITIRKKDYTSNEIAVLVSFMKLQATLSEPLVWKEE